MAATTNIICSMTGFGRGSYADSRFSAEVELRSVNGKGLGIKLRLPNDRLELEPKLETMLRRALSRGTVQGQVRLRSLHRRASAVDHDLMRRYLKEWRGLEKELGLEIQDPGLAELLALPGALEQAPEADAERRAANRAVSAAFKDALAALIEARAKEGASLVRELLRLLGRLDKHLATVTKHQPQVKSAAAERLRQRVQEAWDSIGVEEPLDLSRELVVLAERADVQEELARLEIHLQALRALIAMGGSCGRELEFVIQECHREVTTLGNKSSDVKMSSLVVKMKVLVGQLKEQVANVE